MELDAQNPAAPTRTAAARPHREFVDKRREGHAWPASRVDEQPAAPIGRLGARAHRERRDCGVVHRVGAAAAERVGRWCLAAVGRSAVAVRAERVMAVGPAAAWREEGELKVADRAAQPQVGLDGTALRQRPHLPRHRVDEPLWPAREQLQVAAGQPALREGPRRRR
eukprot:scaffold119121_cov57-Phaeocystis_antarctica.AAC.1